jgi:hypothetical protein
MNRVNVTPVVSQTSSKTGALDFIVFVVVLTLVENSDDDDDDDGGDVTMAVVRRKAAAGCDMKALVNGQQEAASKQATKEKAFIVMRERCWSLMPVVPCLLGKRKPKCETSENDISDIIIVDLLSVLVGVLCPYGVRVGRSENPFYF